MQPLPRQRTRELRHLFAGRGLGAMFPSLFLPFMPTNREKRFLSKCVVLHLCS
jgi:hypothetical protein